jgi:DNA-binding CsgD family transcriptional regulator
MTMSTCTDCTEIFYEDWGKLELPLWLVDLDDFAVRAVSEAAVLRTGVPASEYVGHAIVDHLRVEDRAGTRGALEAMSAGVIDFYRSHRPIGPARAPDGLTAEWVQAVEFGDKRLALVQASNGSRVRLSPLAEFLGREPLEMAVGRTDTKWRVKSVSCDITALLGISADDLVGRPLLGPLRQEDLRWLLDAGAQWAQRECSVSLRVRLCDGAGAMKPLRCVLTSLAGSTDRFFMLIDETEPFPGQGSSHRAAQLERHLRNIAAEVDASGILQSVRNVPEPARFPELGELSARQWEVLSHLLRGERVPPIAAVLFVSQSTVRNHLSAIFGRFGVHSQAELLALLLTPDTH